MSTTCAVFEDNGGDVDDGSDENFFGGTKVIYKNQIEGASRVCSVLHSPQPRHNYIRHNPINAKAIKIGIYI